MSDKPQATPRRVKVEGEANIYKGRSGRYEVCARDCDGKLHWKVVPDRQNGRAGTLADARRQRTLMLAAREKEERPQAPPGLTFGKVAQEYLDNEVIDHQANTQEGYRRAITDHLADWNSRKLTSVRVADVLALIRRMRGDGYSESTIKATLGVVKRIYAYADRHLDVSMSSPTDKLRKGERPNPENDRVQVFFQGTQLEETLTAAQEPWRTLFTLLAGTGCRISEALALRLEDIYLDVDDDDPRVVFRAQLDRSGNRKPLKRRGVTAEREVWISGELAEVLRAHVARSSAGTYLFATRSGRPLSQRNCARALRTAQRAAKRADGTPTWPQLQDGGKPQRGEVPGLHSYRHTHVSRLRHEGWSVEDIAARVGHKDATTTTATYTHAIADQDRRAQRRAQLQAAFPVAA